MTDLIMLFTAPIFAASSLLIEYWAYLITKFITSKFTTSITQYRSRGNGMMSLLNHMHPYPLWIISFMSSVFHSLTFWLLSTMSSLMLLLFFSAAVLLLM